VAYFSLRFGSCADATENDIDRADGIDPKGFYMQLFAAQFGVWLSWATWLVLTVLRIHEILVRPAIFVNDLQDVNKFFFLYVFLLITVLFEVTFT
jgi:hypothetical protein